MSWTPAARDLRLAELDDGDAKIANEWSPSGFHPVSVLWLPNFNKSLPAMPRERSEQSGRAAFHKIAKRFYSWWAVGESNTRPTD